MKAFLLAAGEGKRLRPITNNMPKCLVPIQGKSLLEIWIRKLEVLGIKEVVINTHYFSDQVSHFLNHFQTTLKIHNVYESEMLGSGGTILKNKDFISHEPFFWIIYADNLTNTKLEDILYLHQNCNAILTLGLFHTQIPQECGIVTLDDDGRIVSFVEKPKNPKGDLANAGIMVASPEIVDFIPEKIPCDLSYDVLPKLVGKMYGKVIDDFFMDIGTPESYYRAQKEWGEMEKYRGDRGC